MDHEIEIKSVKLYDRLQIVYSSHLEKAGTQLQEQEKVSFIGRLLMGKGRYSGGGLLEPFLKEVEETIQISSDAGIDADDAFQSAEFILFNNLVPSKSPIALDFIVAEPKAIKIFPFVESENLQALTERYGIKVKKERGLPCQQDVLKALKDESKRR